MCCSVLHCVAVCCTHSYTVLPGSVMQCVTSCCSVLQRVALCCSVLHSLLYCSPSVALALRLIHSCVSHSFFNSLLSSATICFCAEHRHLMRIGNILQHAATRCNVLQHTATHCSATVCISAEHRHPMRIGNTLHHTATYCNTLQHTATYCNILQHTAALQFAFK